MSQDLRDFLSRAEAAGNVRHVGETVKKAHEISTLMMDLEKKRRHPIIVFDQVENSDFPVVTNIIGCRERFAEGLGVTAEKVAATYAARIKNRIEEVKIIKNPPCDAHLFTGDQVNLYDLPILTHFPIDAGSIVLNTRRIRKIPPRV